MRDLSEIIRVKGGGGGGGGGGADFKLSTENDVNLPSDGNEIS